VLGEARSFGAHEDSQLLVAQASGHGQVLGGGVVLGSWSITRLIGAG